MILFLKLITLPIKQIFTYHLLLKFITPIQFIKNGEVFSVTETIEFAHNYKLKNIYYKLRIKCTLM